MKEIPPETLAEINKLYEAMRSIMAEIADSAQKIAGVVSTSDQEQARRYARTRADVEAKRRAARISRPAIRADSRGHQVRYINRRNGTDRRQ